MGFARIAHHAYVSPKEPEAIVKLLALGDRYADIAFSVYYQHRRVDLIEISHWRVLVIQLPIWCEAAIVAVQIARRNIGSRRHGEQVGHCRTGHGRLEAVGMRHDARCHVPTVTPASHSKAIGVGDPLRDQKIDSIHHVLKITAAPIAIICLGEGWPLSVRPTWVREKHDVSM